MEATMEQQAAMIGESRGFYLGLDLGQAADYTALVVIERVRHRVPDPMGALKNASPEYRKRYERPDTYEARHVERFPLGMHYPDVVRRVMGYLGSEELQAAGPGRLALAIDAAGVGRSVYDDFEESVYGSKLERKPTLYPIQVHGGIGETEPHGMWGLPKRDLVARAVKHFQKGELLIAKGLPHTDILTGELKSYRLKVNPATGHDSYESWREKDHDDLVFALIIALWAAVEQGDQQAFTIPLSELRGAKGSGLRLT